MRRIYNTFWTFRTANFTVEAASTWDDDLDLSWDDTGEIARQLAAGTLEAFMVRIRCRHNSTGIEGESYLGGCIYTSAEAFRDERGGYFTDMVTEAVAECRRVVAAANSIQLRAAA